MVVWVGHKFAKRISPSGPLVDVEAFGPLKIQLRPGCSSFSLEDIGFNLDCADSRRGSGFQGAGTQASKEWLEAWSVCAGG